MTRNSAEAAGLTKEAIGNTKQGKGLFGPDEMKRPDGAAQALQGDAQKVTGDAKKCGRDGGGTKVCFEFSKAGKSTPSLRLPDIEFSARIVRRAI